MKIPPWFEYSSTIKSKNNTDETTMMLDSFPIINENLRTNILLSIEIYKKIIDFDINYVHNILKEQKLL